MNKIVTKITSPIGSIFAGATQHGICWLDFSEILETKEIIYGNNKHLNKLKKQLTEYFAGNRKNFDLPLVITGTKFQLSAWQALQEIPFGETRCYQEQAIKIGNPKAVRAVANANANNKIAIIIPCHRVIAKTGKLAGYGGGVWRKQYLLDLERNI
ncbi:MAG: methylated-DNA--[protein]-cysteine S-methyltransferase [Candidatus Marithrix sp.]